MLDHILPLTSLSEHNQEALDKRRGDTSRLFLRWNVRRQLFPKSERFKGMACFQRFVGGFHYSREALNLLGSQVSFQNEICQGVFAAVEQTEQPALPVLQPFNMLLQIGDSLFGIMRH